MKYEIRFGHKQLDLTVHLPLSKSISNRQLCLFYQVGEIHTDVALSNAEDTQVLKRLLFEGGDRLNAGLGGTTLRFALSQLAAAGKQCVISGEEPLKERPVGILVEALREIGYEIAYTDREGFPPLKLNGGTQTTGEIFIDASVSSQFISSLLLAAPQMPLGLTLHLDGNVTSGPYLNMTVAVLEQFGIKVEQQGKSLHVPHQKPELKHVVSERDWSAASYWYSLLAIAGRGRILIKGLSMDGIQGDAVVQDIYKSFGIETVEVNGGAVISCAAKPVKEFEYDFTACPDIAQTAAITCAALGVKASLTGLHTLRIKETDRIEALKNELTKLGCGCVVHEDVLEITGQITIQTNADIQTYHDHRMAMSFAPLAVMMDKVTIHDPEVVIKSYPKFWEELRSAGAEITSLV